MVNTWVVLLAVMTGQVGTTAGNGLRFDGVNTALWLDALGVVPGADRSHTRERLIAVDADGRVVRMVEGQAGRVNIPEDLYRLMGEPDAGFTLVHNHPAGNGLSPNDLEHLEYPGVRAIVAIGHDGSSYAASRGPRYRAGTLLERADGVYAAAQKRATQMLAFERDPGRRAAFDAHLYHVVSAALNDAGVLQYRASLGPARQASFQEAGPFMARVQNVARAAAARELRPPAPEKRQQLSADHRAGSLWSARLRTAMGRRGRWTAFATSTWRWGDGLGATPLSSSPELDTVS